MVTAAARAASSCRHRHYHYYHHHHHHRRQGLDRRTKSSAAAAAALAALLPPALVLLCCLVLPTAQAFALLPQQLKQPQQQQQQVPSLSSASSWLSRSATTTTTTKSSSASTPLTRCFVSIPLDDEASSEKTTTTTTTSFSNNQMVSPVSPGSAPFPKVGVLLLNLGGPETLDDVEGFLYNLFADPDIIRLPAPLRMLQPLIAYIISKRRAPVSKAAYASIGGGSPILQYSQQQADLILQQLQQRHGISNAACYIGMRYWHPFTEDALAQIQKDKVQALVIVPLYPQFSISTSGSSLRVLQEVFAKQKSAAELASSASSSASTSSSSPQQQQQLQLAPPVHTVIPSWYDRPGYINAVADLVQAELEQITSDQVAAQKAETPHIAGKHVLFSAHGVPQSYIAAGDPYQRQMQACVQAIGDEIQKRCAQNSGGGGTGTGSAESYSDGSSNSSSRSSDNNNNHNKDSNVEIHLSYQSRVGPVEWLRPYTDDVLPELGAKGVRNLVVVPISFVSEHIETLEEIDMEYRELAHESGIVNWRRAPALNTHPGFVADMADMIAQALQEPSMTVTEACIANSVGNLVMQEENLQGNGNGGGGGGGYFGDYFNTAGVQNVVGAEGDLRRQQMLARTQAGKRTGAMTSIAAAVFASIGVLVALFGQDSVVGPWMDMVLKNN